MASSVGTARRLASIDFEVFGKVQGVFFRKYTEKKSKEYGLVGWVKNSSSPTRTVVGQLQGQQRNIQLMKHWLSTTGSPRSKITRCEFKNEKTISKLEFSEFRIVR